MPFFYHFFFPRLRVSSLNHVLLLESFPLCLCFILYFLTDFVLFFFFFEPGGIILMPRPYATLRRISALMVHRNHLFSSPTALIRIQNKSGALDIFKSTVAQKLPSYRPDWWIACPDLFLDCFVLLMGIFAQFLDEEENLIPVCVYVVLRTRVMNCHKLQRWKAMRESNDF
jgi:hypothetical protein